MPPSPGENCCDYLRCRRTGIGLAPGCFGSDFNLYSIYILDEESPGRASALVMDHGFHFPKIVASGILVAALLAQAAERPAGGSDGSPSASQARADKAEATPPQKEFTFARLVFRGGSGWRFGAWATDAPKADMTFIAGIKRLTNLDVRESHYYVPITSAELFNYPFLYAVEVGYLELSSEEAEILREYFKRGGFMVVDDFHGTLEWSNFQSQMHKVFPGGRIEDLPASHPLFHCFFDIEELFQIPGVIMFYSGTTYEKDGYNPHFRGVFDENGNLRVMINFNSDLGDAWEWADVPFYPEKYSSAAYRLGINYIIYSMTH